MGLLAPAAQALDLPGTAVMQISLSSAGQSARIPLGPYADGTLPSVLAEGAMTRSAWRIGSTSLTTLQILQPLRTQLVDDGYDILFECADDGCGGFDFRFAVDVIPEPDMHVDLGDYRYVSARKGTGAGADYITLMVSRSPGARFVQITQIGGSVEPESDVITSTKAVPDAPIVATTPSPLGDLLTTDGHAPLDDLVFDSGSSALGPDDFPSLDALADWLEAHPEAQVTLVGHTDATGSLAANEALSRKRAQSVRARLVDKLGVPAGQVSADGVGYLSPRASNLTEDGREKNRRVEVVLTSTR